MYQVVAVAVTKGLQVLGVYSANERLDDTEVSEHTIRFARTVGERAMKNQGFGTTVPLIWQVQNALLGQLTTRTVVRQFALTSSRAVTEQPPPTFAEWNVDTCAPAAVEFAGVAALVQRATEGFVFRSLVDFEEHIDGNLTRDFFNEGLLDKLLSMGDKKGSKSTF